MFIRASTHHRSTTQSGVDRTARSNPSAACRGHASRAVDLELETLGGGVVDGHLVRACDSKVKIKKVGPNILQDSSRDSSKLLGQLANWTTSVNSRFDAGPQKCYVGPRNEYSLGPVNRHQCLGLPMRGGAAELSARS